MATRFSGAGESKACRKACGSSCGIPFFSQQDILVSSGILGYGMQMAFCLQNLFCTEGRNLEMMPQFQCGQPRREGKKGC